MFWPHPTSVVENLDMKTSFFQQAIVFTDIFGERAFDFPAAGMRLAWSILLKIG